MINLTVNSLLSNSKTAGSPATTSHQPSVDDGNATLLKSDSASVSHLSTLALQLSEADIRSNEQPLTTATAGRELMLARIFRGHEPPVSSGVSANAYSAGFYSYLTYEDRALVSQMYAYAQSQGADLTYVDRVASALGGYRYFDDGRRLVSSNNSYDREGHAITYDYLEKDAAAAARILNGTAINTTRFDQGFLRHILDPGFGALTSFGNSIGFLEKMVTRFSSEDAELSVLGSEFATYVPRDVEDNIVITRSKEVMFTLPEPYHINHNGVWTITAKGWAAGYTMDKAGRPRAPAPIPEGQARVREAVEARNLRAQERAFLEALSRSRDLPHWLTSLLKALRNSGGP